MAIGFTGGANNYAYTALTGLSSVLGCSFAVRFRYNVWNASNGSPLLMIVDGVGGYAGIYIAGGADLLLASATGSLDAAGGILRRGFTHHGLITIDGSGNLVGYVDGARVLDDVGVTGITPAYAIAGGNETLSTDGVFQDVMIWSRVLTHDEIWKQARSRTPVSRRGLVNWHPFSHHSRNPAGTGGPIIDWPTVGSSWLPTSTNFTTQRDLAVPVRRRAPILRLAAGGSQTLSPSLVTNTSTLYAPTVTPGAVTLSPPALSDADTLYAPTVTVGGVTLSPPALASGTTLYAPVVSQGGIIVAPPLVSDGDTLYAPTVTPGPVSVLPPALASGTTLYAPTVSTSSYGVRLTWAEVRYQPDAAPATITCVAGAAVGAGAPAAVSVIAGYQIHLDWLEVRYQPTLTPVTVSCTAGRALAAGLDAALELMLALPMNVGAAGARGPRGVVFEIVDSMVMNVGAAEAAGLAFSLTSPTAIACTAGRGAARGRPALLSAANVTIDCGIGAATAYGPAAALSVVQTVACTPAGGAAHGSVVTIVDGPSGPIIFCFRGRAVGAGAPIEFALSAEFRVGAAVARGARATVESGIELYATGSVIGQSSMNPTLMAARGSMGAYAYLDGGPGRAHGLFKMRSRLTPDMRFTVREN